MFYKEIRHKIEQLLATNKNQEALILIQEELKAPYIPQDFEEFLHQKEKEVHAALKEVLPQGPSTFTVQDVKKMLQSDLTPQHLLAIENMEQMNLRSLTREIQSFLLRHEVANDIKSLVLIALKRQEVDQEFQFVSHNEVLKVNPKLLNVKQLSQFNQGVVGLLENTFFQNNRTLTDLAIKVALLFLLDFFPREFDFSIPDVAAMALKHGGKMLGENIAWEEIHRVFSFNLDTARRIFARHELTLD